MKKLFIIVMLMLAMAAQAEQTCSRSAVSEQAQTALAYPQISYIEETKNWYYVYDEKGKRICGLSRGSVGELKGWGSDFFVAKRYSYYHICDAKGRTLKTMNVSDVGEIVGVSNNTITSRKGSWIFIWSKEGKKIRVMNAH
jgi:hypothetical protein